MGACFSTPASDVPRDTSDTAGHMSCPSHSCKTMGPSSSSLPTDGYLTDIPFGSWFPTSHAHRRCSLLFTKHACIDRGATCSVYDITYAVNGRRCALKQIVRSEEFGQPLFITEARCLSKLRQASIIEYVDMWMDDAFYYLVLEKADFNLRELLAQKRYLSETQCKRVTYSLLEALQYMHGKNVAHRDIKPENIVFVGGPGPGHGHDDSRAPAPKLIDFGDAVMCKPGKVYSEFVGTPPYMSPERLRDHNSDELQKSDIWALAAVVYEMWSGKRCFVGASQKEVFGRATSGTWQWLPERMPPKEMQAFVQQCLTLDVTQRLNVTQALAHGWFTDMENSDLKKDVDECADVDEDEAGEVVENDRETDSLDPPPVEANDVMKYDFFDSLTPNIESVPILAATQFSN